MSKINERLRVRINRKNREKLTNMEFSLLASNCNGALILHDLGLRFSSPFVNLWLEPRDFIEYLEHLETYQNALPQFEKDNFRNYPVGILEGEKKVKIYFQHYKTEKEAAHKWLERSKRINRENLFVMMTDRDGCTYEDLKRFDSLSKYKNKVVFTHRKYPELKSAYYIPGFEKQGCVGDLWRYKNKVSGKRIYDFFPYVEWFNRGM